VRGDRLWEALAGVRWFRRIAMDETLVGAPLLTVVPSTDEGDVVSRNTASWRTTMELTVGRDIAARPEKVWTIITDLDHTTETLSGVQRVERIDDGSDFGVGTRWRETRTMFGREATEQMEVTAVEPGRSYTVVAANGTTTYASVLRVQPAAGGTSHLSMTFGARPSGAVASILAATLGRLVQRTTRKMLQRDLDDIAIAAETDRSP
jgi:carbon monoxide dehydrogenase subunit G